MKAVLCLFRIKNLLINRQNTNNPGSFFHKSLKRFVKKDRSPVAPWFPG